MHSDVDEVSTRRVLMIAYHFPPYVGSSGARRTLAFATYLRNHGWEPVLLTVSESAYERTSAHELARIPPGIEVIRCRAFDVARHFAFRGRYLSRLAVPDRWRSWKLFAVGRGMDAVDRLQPAAIWSTYPIATAHAIGAEIARRSGVPWVADMRDPMVELDAYSGIEYPTDPRVRSARLDIERRVVELADRIVFCTPGARRICEERYGPTAAGRFAVISNGYDEQEFAAAVHCQPPGADRDAAGFRLIHSGTVYPGDDRSPGPLFRALATLRDEGSLPPGFRVVLRATGYDDVVAKLAAEAGVAQLVEIAPPLPYSEALGEMLGADGLLLLQGAASNPAIPAKLYEYLRAGRPMLALVHPDGDSADLLARLDAATIARIDDVDSITRESRRFIADCVSSRAKVVSSAVASRFSRETQAAELAAILDSVATERRRH